jgi:hypothetical protein
LHCILVYTAAHNDIPGAISTLLLRCNLRSIN